MKTLIAHLKEEEKLINKIKKEEEKLYALEVAKKQKFGDLWLNTDFVKELNLSKNATEKDKKSYIDTNKEYIDICLKIAKQKACVNHLNNLLNALH